MRFRAQITAIGIFAKILNCIDKSSYLLVLSPLRLRVIYHSPQTWGVKYSYEFHLSPKDALFSDYLVESAYDNEIYLQVQDHALQTALRTCTQSHETILKLSKKNGRAILVLQLADSSLTSQPLLLTHEIPVKVLPPALGMEYHIHESDFSDAELQLPSLLQLKPILEKTKSWSEHLLISLSPHHFCIQIHSSKRRISMTLESVSNVQENMEFLVQTKHFLCFMEIYGMHPYKVSCQVQLNQCILMKVWIGSQEQALQSGVCIYQLPIKSCH